MIQIITYDGNNKYYEGTLAEQYSFHNVKSLDEYSVKQVIVAGGVAANSYLRKEIVEKETGIDVLSIVKLDVIDGKVVIEKTIED